MSKRPTQAGDWSSDSAALFPASRSDHEPTAADRARVRNALAERLADASNGPPASGALGKLVKIGVGIAFVMAAAFAILHAGESKNRAESISTAPEL